jgi:hypothetical protein
MALYTFHELSLEVEQEGQETQKDLAHLLQEVLWVRTETLVEKPSLCLSVCLNGNGSRVPPMAREVFRAGDFRGLDDFCGLQLGDDFYLTDGSSLLQAVKARADVSLAPSFFTKRPLLQQNFWVFTLLKLLRSVGIYSLHAAGVVTSKGLGLLIVGESGSGKSTLAIGLIRQGWRYLSDDALLIRHQVDGVEALAFRKHFYVDASAAAAYADLPLGEEMSDNAGGRKRRVRIEDVYPGQYVPGCIPRVLLFSRIVPCPHSTLRPLDRLSALGHLLVESGPQWFDRGTMAQHLDVLKRLMQQTTTYELRAGLDLYRNPLTLVRLLAEAEGEERWPVL